MSSFELWRHERDGSKGGIITKIKFLTIFQLGYTSKIIWRVVHDPFCCSHKWWNTLDVKKFYILVIFNERIFADSNKTSHNWKLTGEENSLKANLKKN